MRSRANPPRYRAATVRERCIGLMMLCLPLAAAPPGWDALLKSIGLDGDPRIVFVQASDTAATIQAKLAAGALLILEGDTPAARSFGFIPRDQRVTVQCVVDQHQPKAGIVWVRWVELPWFDVPAKATVWTKERWTGAPVAAGFRSGSGAVLWLATDPGARGYDRFPFLPHMLRDLGVETPLEARNLWVFFDSSYRQRADIDWFAERWRAAGVAALHVAAWQYWEPDAARDAWLGRLIEACHRNSILVYAWIEFPHVSEKFWNDHPEWREKTAIGQDAHLDWRKLMNLANPDCARAAEAGLQALIRRFDWDGVNLGELYFESLEGAANPARFTPMNDDVRREFRAQAGFDPLDLFRLAVPDAARLRRFLDYRANLARRLQEDWLARLEKLREAKPHLDFVLTHIDDRFDPTMRDKLGADAARLLPSAAKRNATFLVEDPASLWDLGPQRYPEIARRYQPIAPPAASLAIDINIVERYQDVYPTKQQTGAELFQLVNTASRAFARVALYFESSLNRADWGFLPAAAAGAARWEKQDNALLVESAKPLGVRWRGNARVDGRPWPAADGSRVWLPPGKHRIESGPDAKLLLTDLNADLLAANVTENGLAFRYASTTRALARLQPAPAHVEVDGRLVEPGPEGRLMLPPGRHEVSASLY